MQEGRPGIAGIAGEETTAILRWHTRDANKQHVIGLIGLQLYLPHTVLLTPLLYPFSGPFASNTHHSLRECIPRRTVLKE